MSREELKEMETEIGIPYETLKELDEMWDDVVAYASENYSPAVAEAYKAF